MKKPSVLLIARDNSYGLVREAMVVREQLEKLGHDVATATPRERTFLSRILGKKHADVIIYFERIFPTWYSAADRHYLVPNQERFPHRHIHRLKKLKAVLTKTKHAEEVFKSVGANTIDIGFTSEDRFSDKYTKNPQKFLHLAGGSTLKGTETLLKVWTEHPEWPELVLVQKAVNAPKAVPANVTLHSGYLSDKELLKIQNECGIHLCPSRSEGWGHYIVEALSVGAIVLTTDAPPMNEHVSSNFGFLVPYFKQEPRHIGTNFYFAEDAFAKTIEKIIRLDDVEFSERSEKTREAYELIRNNYLKLITQLSGQI